MNHTQHVAAHSGEQRNLWVDVAKGLGILLVVYGHALRAHFSLVGAQADAWAAWQDRLIYSFHMPLFFFLSGIFLWRSLERDRAGFLRDRWWQLVYPYLLWASVSVCLKLMVGPRANDPAIFQDLWLIPLVPPLQYWFLYSLLLMQLVAVSVFPHRWLLPACAAFGLLILHTVGASGVLVPTLQFAPYLALGVIAPSVCARIAEWPAQRLLVCSLCSAAVLGLMLTLAPASSRLMQSGAAVAGVLAAVTLAMLMAPRSANPVVSTLAAIGRASMAIFVAHTIASAGIRIALEGIGIAADNIVSFAAAVIAGVVVPFCLWKMAADTTAQQWLGLGRARKRLAHSAPQASTV
jgi:fucose 4-O-acetylase-like acetyltransferase